MVITPSNEKSSRITFEEPRICPICKKSIKPDILYSRLHENSSSLSNNDFYIFCECPACDSNFISKYNVAIRENLTPITNYSATKLYFSAPNKFKPENFEKYIIDISPNFVKIYNQALEAENYNLDQISGMGYRKALEFLIKDFLIFENPEKEEKIKNTSLANCINSFIESPQLKIVASRATWLGNDQTHYEQIFKDKDISDLKRLIKLSVNWIVMISLTHEAEAIEKP